MAFSSSSVAVCFTLVLAIGSAGCFGGQEAETNSSRRYPLATGQINPSQSTSEDPESSTEAFSPQPFITSSDGQTTDDGLFDDPFVSDGQFTNDGQSILNTPVGNRPSTSNQPTNPDLSTADTPDTSETSINPPQVAILTAQQADAQINLRSQPTTQSSEQGYGLVGDPVKILKSADGEGELTWYYIQFESSGAEGWVRGDFIDTAGTTTAGTTTAETTTAGTTTAGSQLATGVPAIAEAEDSLGEALDAICGGPANLNAYYSTQNYNIYICNSPNGLIYVGNEKGTNDTLVSQSVTTTETGFVARSGEYTYAIDGTALEVSLDSNSAPLLQEPVEFAERY